MREHTISKRDVDGGNPRPPHPGARVHCCRCSLPGLTGFTTCRRGGTAGGHHERFRLPKEDPSVRGLALCRNGQGRSTSPRPVERDFPTPWPGDLRCRALGGANSLDPAVRTPARRRSFHTTSTEDEKGNDMKKLIAALMLACFCLPAWAKGTRPSKSPHRTRASDRFPSPWMEPVVGPKSPLRNRSAPN